MTPEQEQKMEQEWHKAQEKTEYCQLHPQDSFEYGYSIRQPEIDALTAERDALLEEVKTLRECAVIEAGTVQVLADRSLAAEIERDALKKRVGELEDLIEHMVGFVDDYAGMCVQHDMPDNAHVAYALAGNARAALSAKNEGTK